MKYILLIVISCTLVSGCAAPQSYDLMPPPVVYTDSSIDPFTHISDEHRSTHLQVFYATNRIPTGAQNSYTYSNQYSSTLRFGHAGVMMGAPGTDWETLHRSSVSAEVTEPIVISLETVAEKAVRADVGRSVETEISQELADYFQLINHELSLAVDKEIVVYVHGTKVDFTNAALLTAEVDHFAGRDFVSLAYAWPSHQNILSYLVGTDVKRARESSSGLADVLVLLAQNTVAEKIHILSYSAGGRVTSKALNEIRNRFPGLEPDGLRETMRIGSVVFAAADVEHDVFLERLKAASDIADQITITISDRDDALLAAAKYMGGSDRAGTKGAEPDELAYIALKHLQNVSIVDVSIGQQQRGFDIVGHHYWYRHPWMSSDIIFVMRTDLPPNRRGLQSAESNGLWYLPGDYPARVRKAARTELGDQWQRLDR